MATTFDIILSIAAILLLLPVAVFAAEVLIATLTRNFDAEVKGSRGRVAVVVPAHNEASDIARTLRLIHPQLCESDRLIVVADNCSDDTANIATSEGAETIIRQDAARRGKGYAIDFAVRHLEVDAPDVIVVVDADCEVYNGTIDRLARWCIHTGRPVQALYLLHSMGSASTKLRLAQFASIVKNQVRPLGLRRLRLPCQLMGSGMAFPWSCIYAAQLATGNIVEDLKLGIDLTRAGTPPIFCPSAAVTSRFPQSSEGALTQRTRWEHGHLATILSEVPRILAESIVTFDKDLLACALDLCVPPLALLMLLISTVWCASAILYLLMNIRFPLIAVSVAATLLAFSVFLAWLRFGRQILSLSTLALAGIYALSKVPLYAKFIVARQIAWVRSQRDED